MNLYSTKNIPPTQIHLLKRLFKRNIKGYEVIIKNNTNQRVILFRDSSDKEIGSNNIIEIPFKEKIYYLKQIALE